MFDERLLLRRYPRLKPLRASAAAGRFQNRLCHVISPQGNVRPKPGRFKCRRPTLSNRIGPLAFNTEMNIFKNNMNFKDVCLVNAEMGTMLAEIRDAAGMTQRQVAERMSANQTRVSRIEAGDGDDGRHRIISRSAWHAPSRIFRRTAEG